jgi:hypothetical protein
MKATIRVEMDNAAFFDDDSDGQQNDEAARRELARILRDLSDHIEAGSDGKTLFDLNGNKVGDFSIMDGVNK